MIAAKRILLIEDDEDDQYLFCTAFNAIHPSIHYKIAKNGFEALRLLEECPSYDFILMDLNMPRMDGFECLERLKAKEDVKNIPVIVTSTSNRTEDIEKCKRLGAASFFPKPTSYNELVNELQRILLSEVSSQ
ncbi:MAG: response regulator [Ferruginibacter sp.]